MANSDYSVVGTGQFCSVAKLMTSLSPATTMIGISDLRTSVPGDAVVGSLILIGDEIMQIVSMASSAWTVKRGCLDTIPLNHAANQTIYVIDRQVGSNFTEYLGTQTISVKLLAKAVGGVVPMEYAPPREVVFNQRFARPYPPANFRMNGQPWYLGASVDDVTPLLLTWNERNRVLQSDQVLGHLDQTVASEVGTTYEVVFYTDDLVQVATLSVPAGTSKTYELDDLRAIYGLNNVSSGDYPAALSFKSKRDGLSSLQTYNARFSMDLSTASDPMYAQVAFLLRGDGANGSSSFVDESAFALSGIASVADTAGGVVVYDSSRKKFGISSIKFRGAYLDPISHLDVYNGANIPTQLKPTGDFTIDLWVYLPDNQGGSLGATQNLYSIVNGANNTVISFMLFPDNSLNFIVSAGGPGYSLTTNPMGTGHVVPTDQWVYVAMSYKRVTNEVSLWIGGGSPKATVALSLGSTGITYPTAGAVQIGGGVGNIEDLRLTSALRFGVSENLIVPTRRVPAQ